MIDIIHGRFKVARCKCGCLFKFQEEDIRHIIKKPLFTFNKNKYYLFDFVDCPRCRKRIFESKESWL